MKTNRFLRMAALYLLCFIAYPSFAQSGKTTYRVIITGYPTIIASDCAVLPYGGASNVATITKAADNTDEQFQRDIKNKTKIRTMDVIVLDGSGKETKRYHFMGLVVKSFAGPINKISSVGLGFDTMLEK